MSFGTDLISSAKFITK